MEEGEGLGTRLDETSHTPSSLRARGLTLASQSTRYSVHFRRLNFSAAPPSMSLLRP